MLPELGHNNPPSEKNAMATATDNRLRLIVERVERLEEEKQAISSDIRDVFAEAKAVGYDTKVLREVIKIRKLDPNDRREHNMVLDTYLAALGMD